MPAWYVLIMLQSFLGTFDRSGLRSLRIEDESQPALVVVKRNTSSFWAVLDSQELPKIYRAVVVGRRAEALRLLAEHAVSIGRS